MTAAKFTDREGDDCGRYRACGGIGERVGAFARRTLLAAAGIVVPLQAATLVQTAVGSWSAAFGSGALSLGNIEPDSAKLALAFSLSVSLARPVIADTDGWGPALAATFQSVGAFALASASTDTALVLRLAPGAYTARLSALSGSGEALIEIYEIP